MKFLISTFILMVTALASAKNIKLIDIKSEFDGDTIQIGLSTPNGQNISHVYFKDPTKPIMLFTLDELQNDKQTIVKKAVIPIIQLSAESVTASRFKLNIHYVFHYKLFGSIKKVKPFMVSYIGPIDNFQMIDLETNKVVKNAFVKANNVDGKEVGISTIETW